MHSLKISGPGWQTKEIELTSKAEEDLEAVSDNQGQFRRMRISAVQQAVFNVLAMHDIGTHRGELGANIYLLHVEHAHDLLCF